MKRHLSVVLLGCLISVRPAFGQPAEPTMTVHFIEVGQALSALVEFSCGAMLIDAGSQGPASDHRLIAYLNDFFDGRPDLNRTIDEVLITHNHIDHTNSLQSVVENFTVKRFIDNGFTTGSGAPRTNWLKQQVREHKRAVELRAINDDEVTNLPNKNGLTDSFIDPFACQGVDPTIRILSGRLSRNPGWSQTEFRNLNNHSIVTRIDFGNASFLFLGDLELPAIDLLLDYYTGPARAILDTDVVQVSHHGSRNGTSKSFVDAVTPKVAVIPVGHWSDGRNPSRQFSTFAYGHPNEGAIELLAESMDQTRGEPIEIMVGTGARTFHRLTVAKAIYATDWDGTIRITARADGKLTVQRTHTQ